MTTLPYGTNGAAAATAGDGALSPAYAREAGDPAPGAATHGAAPEPALELSCRCGAGQHPSHPDRCRNGHPLRGSAIAANVGHRGADFWRARAEVVAELRAETARDLGHPSYEDAPAATRVAIDGLISASLVAAAAHHQMHVQGGPLSASGRARRAAGVALEWDRRCESWVRLLGLRRVPKPSPSLNDYLREKRASEGAA